MISGSSLCCFSIVLIAIALPLSVSAPWNAANNPNNMDNNHEYVYALSGLPTSGQITGAIPWSDTYWPNRLGGLAFRWNANPPMTFFYHLHPLAELRQMTQQEIAELSPAEKYDILQGRYDYPTVMSEWRRTSPADLSWEGNCHGWAAASAYYRAQPNPVTLKNSDGISIPFGSSDVKGMLAYFVGVYAFDRALASFHPVGTRCNINLNAFPGGANTPACADINAGALHVVTANQIGIQKNPFLLDRYRGDQIWDQPVYSFSSSVSGNSVRSRICWTDEAGPAWNSFPPKTVCGQYSYSLDRSGSGAITGGTWQQYDRPDFAFFLVPPAFYGYMSGLASLYRASIADRRRGAPEQEILTTSNVTVCNAHELLTNTTGELSLALKEYAAGVTYCWTIEPAEPGIDLIRIKFDQFQTERFRAIVKVYEGASGEGALIAAHHGSDIPPVVEVMGPAAYVVVSTDPTAQQATQGFQATYTAINRD